MLKNKLILCFFASGLVVLLLIGCGQQSPNPETQIEVIDQSAREERLETFDNQLANINDETTARTAITSFADYVEGMPTIEGSSALSVRVLSVDLVDRIAKLEVKARQNILRGGMSALIASDEGVITIDKVTEALNLAKDPSISEIKKDDVEFIQAGIRSELPHIVPGATTDESFVQSLSSGSTSSSDVITPIEAMVIGYAIASGSDGSAEPGAYKANLPQEKVEAFINKVIE